MNDSLYSAALAGGAGPVRQAPVCDLGASRAQVEGGGCSRVTAAGLVIRTAWVRTVEHRKRTLVTARYACAAGTGWAEVKPAGALLAALPSR